MLPKGKSKDEEKNSATIARDAQDSAPAGSSTRENSTFHYPVVREFTGRIQYAKNRAAEAQTTLGKSLRGEVHQVSERQKRAAIGLVQNGDYSHVAADTPLGQPDEYKTTARQVAKTAATESEQKPSSTTSTGTAATDTK